MPFNYVQIQGITRMYLSATLRTSDDEKHAFNYSVR